MTVSNVGDFIGPVRTIMTTILGFSEMLADPELTLSADKRREYELILVQSSASLAEHIEQQATEMPPSQAA